MDTLQVDPTNTSSAKHSYSIRHMQAVDIPHIVDLGAEFHKNSGYKRVPFDYMRTSKLFRDGLHDHRFLCLVVERDDGKIVGGLAAQLMPYWFSSSVGAFDLMLLLTEGTGKVRSLVKRYIQWAKDNKAIEICMGTTTRVNTEKHEQLFRAMGFEFVGSIWKMGS